ncbi:hypothetical protein PR048_026023 [Dryococelus australis]|uniref:Mutator-like transposase domain-containing protein n=1 Tax=Dryococelus australis TaxID=614101 RepID=A0ABQ9GK77_9NEOP|nr:hypothetical protein PR048_026023 [Dryococelus australis]
MLSNSTRDVLPKRTRINFTKPTSRGSVGGCATDLGYGGSGFYPDMHLHEGLKAKLHDARFRISLRKVRHRGQYRGWCGTRHGISRLVRPDFVPGLVIGHVLFSVAGSIPVLVPGQSNCSFRALHLDFTSGCRWLLRLCTPTPPPASHPLHPPPQAVSARSWRSFTRLPAIIICNRLKTATTVYLCSDRRLFNCSHPSHPYPTPIALRTGPSPEKLAPVNAPLPTVVAKTSVSDNTSSLFKQSKVDIYDETSGEDSSEDVSDTVEDITSTHAVKKARLVAILSQLRKTTIAGRWVNDLQDIADTACGGGSPPSSVAHERLDYIDMYFTSSLSRLHRVGRHLAADEVTIAVIGLCGRAGGRADATDATGCKSYPRRQCTGAALLMKDEKRENHEKNLYTAARGEYGAALECKGRGNGRTRENPPDSDINRHLFPHAKIRGGGDPAGNRTRSPWWEATFMCDRKAFPSPWPSAAPLTSPAMSTTFNQAGCLLQHKNDHHFNTKTRRQYIQDDSQLDRQFGRLFNSEVLRADEGDGGVSTEQRRNERVGEREIPEKTHRNTIPKCENPECPGRGLNPLGMFRKQKLLHLISLSSPAFCIPKHEMRQRFITLLSRTRQDWYNVPAARLGPPPPNELKTVFFSRRTPGGAQVTSVHPEPGADSGQSNGTLHAKIRRSYHPELLLGVVGEVRGWQHGGRDRYLHPPNAATNISSICSGANRAHQPLKNPCRHRHELLLAPCRGWDSSRRTEPISPRELLLSKEIDALLTQNQLRLKLRTARLFGLRTEEAHCLVRTHAERVMRNETNFTSMRTFFFTHETTFAIYHAVWKGTRNITLMTETCLRLHDTCFPTYRCVTYDRRTEHERYSSGQSLITGSRYLPFTDCDRGRGEGHAPYDGNSCVCARVCLYVTWAPTRRRVICGATALIEKWLEETPISWGGDPRTIVTLIHCPRPINNTSLPHHPSPIPVPSRFRQHLILRYIIGSLESGAGMKGRGKREIPEKTRRPAGIVRRDSRLRKSGDPAEDSDEIRVQKQMKSAAMLLVTSMVRLVPVTMQVHRTDGAWYTKLSNSDDPTNTKTTGRKRAGRKIADKPRPDDTRPLSYAGSGPMDGGKTPGLRRLYVITMPDLQPHDKRRHAVVRWLSSGIETTVAGSTDIGPTICRQVVFAGDSYSSAGHGNGNLGYILVDFSILEKNFSDYSCCNLCGEPVTLKEELSARNGLATKLVVLCVNCDFSNPFYTSKKCKGNLFDSNVRFVYGMRAIGKASLWMNKYTEVIGTAVKTVATASMKTAAEEAIQLNDGDKNIPVAFDGPWKKRGHASKNSVATVTSEDSGKGLDSEVLSKHCFKCNYPKEEHNCDDNYEGTKFLGDGDSTAHKRVVEENPYKKEIKKIECVGHVQKRIGTNQAEKLKQSLSGEKKNFLILKPFMTGSVTKTIYQFQRYYGTAIRSNTNNLENMKKAIWTTNCNKFSTDEKPVHHLCPPGPDTWCKYRKAERTSDFHSHEHSIPEAVMEVVKPIYRDLAHPDLFKVLQELYISPGPNAAKTFTFLDKVRIQKSQRAAELSTKEARVHNRKRFLKENEEMELVPEYRAETGSVKKKRRGRRKTATDVVNAINILAAAAHNRHVNTRQVARESGISQRSNPRDTNTTDVPLIMNRESQRFLTELSESLDRSVWKHEMACTFPRLSAYLVLPARNIKATGLQRPTDDSRRHERPYNTSSFCDKQTPATGWLQSLQDGATSAHLFRAAVQFASRITVWSAGVGGKEEENEWWLAQVIRLAVRWRHKQIKGIKDLASSRPPSEVAQWPNYLKPVHDKVSTFEINLRKNSPPLHVYRILTGTLSDMRPVKLVTTDGKKFHILTRGAYALDHAYSLPHERAHLFESSEDNPACCCFHGYSDA